MSYKICKTSFNKKNKNSKVDCFEAVNINKSDGSVFNFVKISSMLCNNSASLISHDHVAYLNILVDLSKDLLSEYQNKDFFVICIFSVIRFSLWNDCKLVRTAALRCLRYYLLNSFHMELFLKMRIDFLIMRSLDLSYDDAANNPYRGNGDAERIHSMRVLYRLSVISPRMFPYTLIGNLTMICMSAAEATGGIVDIALRPALLILCQLLILQPNLSSKSEILRALQTVIVNQDGKPWSLNFRIVEAVLLTQLKLVTQTPWRAFVPPGYFNKTFTPFSILSVVKPEPQLESGYLRNYANTHCDFETTAISVLLTIFQSWSGLFYLFGSNNQPILSLTGLLGVGCGNIRGRILDLLFQLFDIFRPPVECKDFVSSLRAIENQYCIKNRPHWSLDDEFLVGQCKDCLPHISTTRINIIDNYQSILLGMFIQCNLFEALENAVADDNESISSRAGILLGNIAYKIAVLLPADHPLRNRSFGSLLFNNPKAQKALLWIEQIHQIFEQDRFEISPFLMYIIQQYPNHNVNDYSINTKRFLQPSNIDEILDSFYTPVDSISKKNQSSAAPQASTKNYRVAALLDQTVRYSRIFETTNEKAFYDLWNWDMIMVFTRSLVDSKHPILVDKDSLSRVLRALLKFFTIQKNSNPNPRDYNGSNDNVSQFAFLPLTWRYSSNAAIVLTDVICYLVECSKDTESCEELNSFLSVIHSCLKDCLISVADDDYGDIIREQFGSGEVPVITEYDLNYKCSSYLILAVGRMSVSDLGEILLEKSGIVELFKAFLDYSRDDILTKLILGSLDYTRPSLGRSLLSIAIRSNNLHTRRYSTKFLKVLLRAKVPFFANWGVNLLVKQLHDCDPIVKQAAFEILQEASDDEVVVNNLLVESIATVHVDYQGYMVFSRLLSLPSHYDKLTSKDGVNFFLDTWNEKFNTEYCKKLDEQLLQYFTYYEIPFKVSDDPDENRISNKIKCRPRELILPCHPYGSISEHKLGMENLLARGDLQKCLTLIHQEWQNLNGNFKQNSYPNFLPVDDKELLLRSSMLAICHVSTSSWGLEFTLDNDIPLFISELTQFHSSLNVRGTGLLCLGLIGSTRRGADALLKYNWLALRSDRHHKWPLFLETFSNSEQHQANSSKYNQTNYDLYNLGDNESSEDTSTTGYSSIAMQAQIEIEPPEKKSSFVLMNDPSFMANKNIFKKYAQSIDDSFLKPRAITGVSSCSSTYTTECDPTKLNKLISHRREFSAGTASMFTMQSDDRKDILSPHDILGMATIRRLQRKSRVGLFSKNHLSVTNSFVECNDRFCHDHADQSSKGDFSNIKKDSSILRRLSKYKKKFSGFLNTKSNLNKYRGIALPFNFNDIASRLCDFSADQYLERFRNEKSIMSDLPNEANSSVKSSIQGTEEKDSLLHGSQSISGLFSFEESSCILDIALLANTSQDSGSRYDQKKSLRASSDEQTRYSKEYISPRPRAVTTDTCSFNYPHQIQTSRSNKSLNFSIFNFRNKIVFTGNDLPVRNELINGLMLHSHDYCLDLNCQCRPVVKEIIEFRQKIVKSISHMLSIGSRSKKIELSLARLKNSSVKSLWDDPCLYSEICALLSLYSFSRQSRQYIQELFLSIPMTSLQEDMRTCLEEFSEETDVRCSLSTRL